MNRHSVNYRHVVLQITLLIAALLWSVIRIGPGFMDLDLLMYSRLWPNPDLGEGALYFRSSPFGPLLTSGLSVTGYMAIHAFAIGLFLLLAFIWMCIASPPRLRITGMRLFVLSPVVAVLLLHIGLYDSFTCVSIAIVLLAWLSNRWWLLFVASIPLGFQHFEQGVVVLTVWLLALAGTRDQLTSKLRRLSVPWPVLPGLILGKALLSLILVVQDLSPLEGRSSVFFEWMSLSFRVNVGKIPFILWGSLLGLWILFYMVWDRANKSRDRIYLIIALIVAFSFGFVTLDNIRVITIVTLPLTLLLIISWLARRSEHPKKGDIATEGLFWLIPPFASFSVPADQWATFINDFRSLSKL